MQIGNGRTFLGDTIEVMDDLIMFGEKIDFVMTSPPYNMKGHAKENYNNAQSFSDNKTNQEYKEWLVAIFGRYSELLEKDGVIFLNLNYMSSEQNKAINLMRILCAIEDETPFTLIEQICWKKNAAMPLPEARLSRIWENVFVFIRKDDWKTFWIKYKKKLVGKTNFIEAPNNDGANEINKACFSSSLVKQLLTLYDVQEKHVVLDNFMGTHTTAIACETLKCKWIGIELDEETRTFGCDRLYGFLKEFAKIKKYGADNLFSAMGDEKE